MKISNQYIVLGLPQDINNNLILNFGYIYIGNILSEHQSNKVITFPYAYTNTQYTCLYCNATPSVPYWGNIFISSETKTTTSLKIICYQHTGNGSEKAVYWFIIGS